MSLLSRIAHALGITPDDAPVVQPDGVTVLITCPVHGDTTALDARLDTDAFAIEWECPGGHHVSSPLRLTDPAWRQAALLLVDVDVPDRVPGWWG